MGIIRFILAISVVLAHSSSIFGFGIVGGRIAVQAFYIISGFYMALVLNEKYIGQNSSYKLFITNRLLRLFPIYWLILSLTFLSSIIILYISDGSIYGKIEPYIIYYKNISFLSFLFLIFTNLFLFFQDIVMFLGLNTSDGGLFFTPNYKLTDPKLYKFLLVPQAWTIGVEIIFYTIAPFISRKKPLTIFILILLSILLRLYIYNLGYKHDPWTYRFFPTELVFFLFGILSYNIYTKIKKVNFSPFFYNTIIFLVILLTLTYDKIDLIFKSYFYFVLLFLALPFIFNKTKTSKIDYYIGDLSYPIYISHLFIYYLLKDLNINSVNYIGLQLTFLTIIFSIILNKTVTKKVEKFRQRRIIKSK